MATFQQDLGCPPPPLDQLAQALLSVDNGGSGDVATSHKASASSEEPAGEEVLHWMGMVLVRQLLPEVATALATSWDDHTVALVNRSRTRVGVVCAVVVIVCACIL